MPFLTCIAADQELHHQQQSHVGLTPSSGTAFAPPQPGPVIRRTGDTSGGTSMEPDSFRHHRLRTDPDSSHASPSSTARLKLSLFLPMNAQTNAHCRSESGCDRWRVSQWGARQSPQTDQFRRCRASGHQARHHGASDPHKPLHSQFKLFDKLSSVFL